MKMKVASGLIYVGEAVTIGALQVLLFSWLCKPGLGKLSSTLDRFANDSGR